MKTSLALIALLIPVATVSAAPTTWRTIAAPHDRERIRTWRDIWEKALAKASPAHAAEIAAAGATLQPDAGLIDPAPPPGAYRCRAYKIGGSSPANPDFTVVAPQSCRIARNDEGALRFTVLDGVQRPAGTLYPDRDQRLVLLGAMILSDERKSMRYGTDSERSVAGLMQRVAADRWRLVLPSPRWEAMLEVIELVPA